MPDSSAADEASSRDEATVRALEQKIALLEQGMKQAAHVRELWGKAVRELKATKVELKKSIAELTTTQEELEQKNESLEQLNIQLKAEIELRERMEVELRLAQKLESIGQLAAGIAHEINTPIQYIGNNTQYLGSAFESYLALFNQLRPLAELATVPGEPIAGAIEIMRDRHLDDLAEDIPEAIAETLEGIEHVAQIVKSMKEFSSNETHEKGPVDINHALETTVNVARSEWKDVAEIEWRLSQDLPEVYAVRVELNQVFLNILINAAQAVGVANLQRDNQLGVITIATGVDGDGVAVKVTDTGVGIPPEIKDQIFDLFFTTKDVGIGSGQGLSIAHSIIVDHHDGRIEVDSEPGIGATFTVWLPASGTCR